MELNRVETTLVAFQVGPCREWSEDHIHAHGMASRANPLGAALDHLLNKPNGINARIVAMMVAERLVKQKIASSRNSWDVAQEAISYWLDYKCPDCNGRGVINFEQDVCQTCGGNGRKHRPKDQSVYRAIGMLEAAMESMEMGLRRVLTSNG